jgi:hypothetical protein
MIRIEASPVNEIHELLVCINRTMILGGVSWSKSFSKVAVVPQSDGVVVSVFAVDESLNCISAIIQNEAGKRFGQLQIMGFDQVVLT